MGKLLKQVVHIPPGDSGQPGKSGGGSTPSPSRAQLLGPAHFKSWRLHGYSAGEKVSNQFTTSASS